MRTPLQLISIGWGYVPTAESEAARAQLGPEARRAAERAVRRGEAVEDPTTARYAVAIAREIEREDPDTMHRRAVAGGVISVVIGTPLLLALRAASGWPPESWIGPLQLGLLVFLGSSWESRSISRARQCIASCEAVADPPTAPDTSAELPRRLRIGGFLLATVLTAALTAAWFGERGDPDPEIAAVLGVVVSCGMVLAGRHYRRLRDDDLAGTIEIPPAPEPGSRALSS